MDSCRMTVASVFVLLTVCVGQAGKGHDAIPQLFQIGRVLHAAQVSGALAYSSCGFHKRVPDDLPPMRVLAD